VPFPSFRNFSLHLFYHVWPHSLPPPIPRSPLRPHMRSAFPVFPNRLRLPCFLFFSTTLTPPPPPVCPEAHSRSSIPVVSRMVYCFTLHRYKKGKNYHPCRSHLGTRVSPIIGGPIRPAKFVVVEWVFSSGLSGTPETSQLPYQAVRGDSARTFRKSRPSSFAFYVLSGIFSQIEIAAS